MEVILLERVENLGFMGDIVKVRPGYARNYLLPQSKALRKSDANLKYFETQKAELEARNLQRRQDAEQVAERMAGLAVVLVRQASEGGQLYGSVTARDLADALKDEGLTVGRSQVQLNAPLKALGVYEVRVSLHPEVAVTVGVTIARSLEDAERQAAAAAAAEAGEAVEGEIEAEGEGFEGEAGEGHDDADFDAPFTEDEPEEV